MGRSVFGCRPPLLCPNQERMIACRTRYLIAITTNFSAFKGWCINAATTMMEIACCWTMAGSPASASRVFPGRWSANTFEPQSCRWTENWKQLCSIRTKVNAAAGAGRCSVQVPTGGNIAPTAPPLFTVSRRPSANGGVGRSVDN